MVVLLTSLLVVGACVRESPDSSTPPPVVSLAPVALTPDKVMRQLADHIDSGNKEAALALTAPYFREKFADHLDMVMELDRLAPEQEWGRRLVEALRTAQRTAGGDDTSVVYTTVTFLPDGTNVRDRIRVDLQMDGSWRLGHF